MFNLIVPVLVFALTPSFLLAADTGKIGYSGTLSSLDGGLEGTVTVVNANTLEITDFQLEDGSAPALYWWGSVDDDLSNGFRISNEQVKDTSDGSDLKVNLDAGKTTADFTTVGLWCERFDINFGQTTLQASDGGARPSGSSEAAATSSAGEASSTGDASNTAATLSIHFRHGIIASLAIVTASTLWTK